MKCRGVIAFSPDISDYVFFFNVPWDLVMSAAPEKEKAKWLEWLEGHYYLKQHRRAEKERSVPGSEKLQRDPKMKKERKDIRLYQFAKVS